MNQHATAATGYVSVVPPPACRPTHRTYTPPTPLRGMQKSEGVPLRLDPDFARAGSAFASGVFGMSALADGCCAGA